MKANVRKYLIYIKKKYDPYEILEIMKYTDMVKKLYRTKIIVSIHMPDSCEIFTAERECYTEDLTQTKTVLFNIAGLFLEERGLVLTNAGYHQIAGTNSYLGVVAL